MVGYIAVDIYHRGSCLETDREKRQLLRHNTEERTVVNRAPQLDEGH